VLLEEMRDARARSRSVCSSVLFSLSLEREKMTFLKRRKFVFVFEGVKRLCVSLFLFMRCILLQLDIVCVYMSRPRGVNLRFSSSGRCIHLHIRSLWRSSNTRVGCFRERKSKSTNSRARRFRASI